MNPCRIRHGLPEERVGSSQADEPSTIRQGLDAARLLETPRPAMSRDSSNVLQFLPGSLPPSARFKKRSTRTFDHKEVVARARWTRGEEAVVIWFLRREGAPSAKAEAHAPSLGDELPPGR